MTSRFLGRIATVVLVLGPSILAGPPPEAHGQATKRRPESGPGEYRFVMSKALVCESVAGFDDFAVRPEPALTADEKLLIYYEPRNFETEKAGDRHQAHFIQDARLRRRDEKSTIWTKDKILDFVAKSDRPPAQVYLTNTIALKGLKPGEYDLDIILHDAVAKGRPATQTVRFTIKPGAADRETDGKEDGGKPPR